MRCNCCEWAFQVDGELHSSGERIRRPLERYCGDSTCIVNSLARNSSAMRSRSSELGNRGLGPGRFGSSTFPHSALVHRRGLRFDLQMCPHTEHFQASICIEINMIKRYSRNIAFVQEFS